ncbi:UvrD-helicase domain-containing protein [Paenibacillus sp. TRM 82003]|nr:UvrD-helicase domain-containing protein [Paenibacillus sp. TRM 82003]
MTEAMLRQDEEARRRIESELDTTFLVEAGAGSGKTTSIVARMLALIESGKANVGDIAAITFTNKAAAELRGRFRLKLEQRIRTAETEEIRGRLERALSEVADGFVGTIHAFCGRLLRERPMEAKLDPRFAEMDEAESKERLNRYWDEYVSSLRERGEEDGLEALAALGIHVEDLRAVFLCVATYEDVQVFAQETPRPDFDTIRWSLLPLIEEGAAALPTNRPDGGWDPLQQAIRSAQSFLRSRGLEDDLAALSLAGLFDRSLGVTQKRWPDPKKAKALKERFAEWRSDSLLPFLEAWREFLHPHVVGFVQPAVRYAQERRLAEGALSFQDLLMRATALLREHPSVREYFAARYSRLFVDEFQDTDPVQAEMMLWLTGRDPQGGDWRRQRPRPGSLFIVGDPKQSIYRFRRADISTYNFVKSVVAADGDVLQLTRNFRSAKAIGDFVNYAFEAAFLPPGRTDDHQAAYVKMLTARENPKGSKAMYGVYTLTAPKAEYDRKAEIARADAERIARWIAWACDGNVNVADRENGIETFRPARPDDVLILLKYREFIGLYAETLEAYGVPADTSGSQVMYEELRALALMTRCLNDPSDRVPLLAVLRGMLFGVSDASLYAYTKEYGRLSLFPPTAERAEVPESARSTYDAIHRLHGYWQRTKREPALSAFLRIIEESGVIPYASSQPSGSIRSGTTAKLLEAIGEHADACSDWNGLTRLLGDIAESSGLEGASLFAGSGRSVRIMNLHKAKGLEAPIVVLACPCGDSDRDATEHIDRMNDPAMGYFTITRRSGAFQTETIAQPVGWASLVEKERRYANAEKDRLLYVAATRAKQLMLVSRYPCKPAIDPWSALEPALKGQPELEDVVKAERPREDWSGAFDAEKALRAWRERHADALRPTYDVTSVTAETKRAGIELLPRPADGRGMPFGNVVHRALEAIGNGGEEPTQSMIDRFAEAEGLEPRWRADATAMIAAVVESELWRRALRSPRRYHEFSFATSERKDGLDNVLHGVIDLVFEEAGGWVIVDFKTDAFEPEHEEAFIRHYEPQIAMYADRWRRMTALDVKEAGLYFVDRNRYVAIHKGTCVP